MIAEPSYRQSPEHHLDGHCDVDGSMPQLPDASEAMAWVMVTCEGKTQAEVADNLHVTQSAVSRMVDRAAAKIDKLVSLRWIGREQLERNIRRAVGLAARN